MKKYLRLILHIILIGFISLSASAQKTFGELSDIKGVKTVYIGKTMLKMASSINLADISISDIDVTKLVGKLNSIEIISCDGKSRVKKVVSKADKILKKMPLETISEVNNDGSIVDISGIYKDGSDVLSTLVIKVLKNDSTLNIVMLTGEIDLENLQAAMAN